MSETRTDIVVPDYTEPIIAVRAWTWRPEFIARHPRTGAPVLVLHSVFHQTPWGWGADGRIEAHCFKEPDPFTGPPASPTSYHQAPQPDCSCGIYALSDVGGLVRGFDSPANVLGVVALSGRVIPGSRGWRAQRAQVIGLFRRGPAPVDVLAQMYGVPVLSEIPALTPSMVADDWDEIDLGASVAFALKKALETFADQTKTIMARTADLVRAIAQAEERLDKLDEDEEETG